MRRDADADRLVEVTARAWLCDALSNLPHPELSDLRHIAAGLTDKPIDDTVPVEAQRRVACLAADLKRHLHTPPAAPGADWRTGDPGEP